jgi:hypothetical protein
MENLKYNRTIDDIFSLSITHDNIATMSGDSDQQPAIVKLASDDEAQKLIKEFEDADGELCHDEDAIMTKYLEFHPFRP